MRRKLTWLTILIPAAYFLLLFFAEGMVLKTLSVKVGKMDWMLALFFCLFMRSYI